MTHTHIEKWNKGRFWFRELFHVEWVVFSRHLGASLRFFDGDSDRDICLFIGCGLFAFWFVLDSVLPRKWVPDYTKCGTSRETGFSYFGSALWFYPWTDRDEWHRDSPWYLKSYTIHMPWDYVWVRTSTKLRNNAWHHELKNKRADSQNRPWSESYKWLKDHRWTETHPYKYTHFDGTVQTVNATLYVEEREWRQRWLKWTKLFATKKLTIGIDFDSEVGEETGSWKGGVLGCGYDLKPNERPIDALRRMEYERTFSRQSNFYA